MKDGWSDHRQSVNVLFRNIFLTENSFRPASVCNQTASRNQFARGMSSNLLQSVFKLIRKGFAKGIFSNQLQSASEPNDEGLRDKFSLVQL